MSIFKNSFTPEIRKSLDARQKAIEKRSPQAIQYLNARNATESYEAVIKVESEIADVIALENGYDLDSAKELYKAFSNVRKGLMNSFQQNGFWVDDATGNLITSPFWKSEMPNVIPMMDFKDFDNFLKVYKRLVPSGEAVTKAGLITISNPGGYPNPLDGNVSTGMFFHSDSIARGDLDALPNVLGLLSVCGASLGIHSGISTFLTSLSSLASS